MLVACAHEDKLFWSQSLKRISAEKEVHQFQVQDYKKDVYRQQFINAVNYKM